VVTQLALSFALLAGAGVLSSHFRQLAADDLGMELDGLYTMRVSLEQERFAPPEARAGVVDELTRALGAVPGVEAVGYSTVNPLCCGDWGAPLAVEGVEHPEGSTHLIHHRMVGSGYFAAAGIPLLRGRDFDDRERPGSAPTVIVDEALADRFWPGEDPLGKRVRIDRPGAVWMTVVGVVGDVDEEGDYSETWYLPYTRDPIARSSENLHFMLRGTDVAVLQAAREAVRSVDPDLAVYEQAEMTSLRAGNISQDRLGAVLGTGFAAFGLLLAALGVFGTLSYSVGTRSREIGTRIALGARPGEVTQLILRGALKLTLLGVLVGLTLALALTRVLGGLIEGVGSPSPPLLGGLGLVLLGTSLTAAAIPAIRASRIDPAVAFRD
jgi:putative ABC transport system permease protein